LRHAQSDPAAAGEAASLLSLALRHLERGRVRLVLVGGLPGTGKTTLTAALADATGWSLLRSDEVRWDLGAGHRAGGLRAPSGVGPDRRLAGGDLSEATEATLAACDGAGPECWAGFAAQARRTGPENRLPGDRFRTQAGGAWAGWAGWAGF